MNPLQFPRLRNVDFFKKFDGVMVRHTGDEIAGCAFDAVAFRNHAHIGRKVIRLRQIIVKRTDQARNLFFFRFRVRIAVNIDIHKRGKFVERAPHFVIHSDVAFSAVIHNGMDERVDALRLC